MANPVVQFQIISRDPEATAHVSGTIAKILFWIHETSGPVAVGVLTLALGAAATGYAVSALGWRLWHAKRGLAPPGE